MPANTTYNTNGAIVWEGASPVDGAPIAMIVTGLGADSANDKTGAMLQTWILRTDVHPSEALATGADVSICGRCIHRPRTPDGFNRDTPGAPASGYKRSCYVRMQAPPSVWRCFKRGRYARIGYLEWLAVCKGRAVRFGSYGDPAMVPVEYWIGAATVAKRHTGYTHQSAEPFYDDRLTSVAMLSADSAADAIAAADAGARTFRVLREGESLLPNEIGCPAAKENGKRTTCADCGLCAGAATIAKSIGIYAHGNGAGSYSSASA